MVEITPEIQAQLDEQKAQCIFCKIMAGEMEGKKVYSDDLIEGILDINPGVQGHTLLMTKEHYPIMPFIPGDTFKHMFGLLPKFVAGWKKTLLRTGANIFIANGGVAGQQANHFLIHLLPRENGDNLDKYSFEGGALVDDAKMQKSYGMIANNLPIMMQNHFGRHPAKWHDGNVKRGSHLTEVGQVLYEDEKALVAKPASPQCEGHMVVYPQEDKQFEEFDDETSAHLFFAASFGATAVFEGLKAQGSNIILKTGVSEDNPTGKVSIHILPRWQDDGLDLLWTPKQGENLDAVADKLKDEAFYISHALKKPTETKVVEETEVEVMGEEKKSAPTDEISAAISRLK